MTGHGKAPTFGSARWHDRRACRGALTARDAYILGA
jgi:hypothetical protein